MGSDVFTDQHLNNLSASHQELLFRLPEWQDLQASWLLLLFCASPRSNYILRMLPPPATAEFSTRHDEAVATCLTDLLQSGPLPVSALALAHLPLSEGGLGMVRLDRRNHQCQCCALGVLGRHPPRPPATASQPGPPPHPTTARPHQCIPSHPSSSGHCTSPSDLRLGTPFVGHPNRPQRATPRRPRASGPPAPRMAAARRQGHPPSLHCPSQPSPSRLPVRTLCEPSIHQHPIHRRVHLLFRTLSFAYASETPSAPLPVHQDLLMPLHS